MDLNFLKPKDPVPPVVTPEVRQTPSVPAVDRKLKPSFSTSSKSTEAVHGDAKRVEAGEKTSGHHGAHTSAVRRQPSPEIIKATVSPSVPDRKTKPRAEAKEGSSERQESSRTAQAEAANELKELQLLRKKKQEEYDAFQKDKDRMVAEHKARQAKLEADRKAIEDIQNLKDKELRETADLMRKKRKAEEDLKMLEEEKNARDQEERKRSVKVLSQQVVQHYTARGSSRRSRTIVTAHTELCFL